MQDSNISFNIQSQRSMNHYFPYMVGKSKIPNNRQSLSKITKVRTVIFFKVSRQLISKQAICLEVGSIKYGACKTLLLSK